MVLVRVFGKPHSDTVLLEPFGVGVPFRSVDPARRHRPWPNRAGDGREEPEAAGERVTRGGAHDSAAIHLRAAWRGNGVSRGPRAGHHNVGFRCARDAPLPA